MRLALVSSGFVVGLMSLTGAACSHTHDRDAQSRPYVPTAAEQRRIDEKRADQRLAEERREDQKTEERLTKERREEDRRAEERRIAADRRADERAKGLVGPNDHVVRAGPASASESIAAARCDREVKCNRVGTHGKYPSHSACVAELKRDIRSDLRNDTCADGVRDKELNDCLQAIRVEQCGNALDMDAVIRIKACRVDNLCVK